MGNFCHAIFQSLPIHFRGSNQIKTSWETMGCVVHKTKRSLLHADVLQIFPTVNNGTHGSMNHALRRPHYTPAPPAERSTPVRCQLISLDPADNLGCSCPALVGTVARIHSRVESYSDLFILCLFYTYCQYQANQTADCFKECDEKCGLCVVFDVSLTIKRVRGQPLNILSVRKYLPLVQFRKECIS